MTVEGSGGGVLDQEIRNITIPDLTARAVRTQHAARSTAARTPRELPGDCEQRRAVPPARREFSRPSRLLIRFDSYGPGNEVPTPTAALLNNNGQKFTTCRSRRGCRRHASDRSEPGDDSAGRIRHRDHGEGDDGRREGSWSRFVGQLIRTANRHKSTDLPRRSLRRQRSSGVGELEVGSAAFLR
jgi:hypothetical protein